MTLASHYFERLKELHTEIAENFDMLNKMQSEADKQVSAIYHEIEKHDFDESEGFQYARELKDVLQRRRCIKSELVQLQPAHDLLRRHISEVEREYKRRVKKGEEVARSLNATITIEAVLS